MVLSIGRVLKPIGTAIRNKINEAEERKKFEQDLKKKEEEEYRKQKLAKAGEIAQARVDREIKLAKQGKSTGTGNKGVFHQLTGQDFFIKPQAGKTSGSRKASSDPFAGLGQALGGGGLSNADRELLGMKKESNPKKRSGKKSDKTIVIKV